MINKTNLFSKKPENTAVHDDSNVVSRIVESLKTFGKEESEECKGSIEMYTIHLKQIESGHIVKREKISEDQNREIEDQNNQIKLIYNQIEDYKAEIKDINEVLLKQKDLDIKAVKDEREALEKTNPKDIIDTREKFRPWIFYTALFVSILLLGFIYYFYVNLGYVLFDLPQFFPPEIAFDCDPSVLNSLAELKGEGGCGISLSMGPLLLPILFLAIAVLIHLKIESLLNTEGKKYKAVIGIGFFLILVLVLDTILAIRFEERLYNWEGKGGINGEPFPKGIIEQIKYSYDEPAFLLILGLGFIGYIVWSLITHEASKEYDRKDPENVWRRSLRRLDEKIKRLMEERNELIEKASKTIPDKIRELDKEINNIKQRIKLIRIGGKDKLRQGLIEFTIGWNQYLSFRYDAQESNRRIAEVKQSFNEFIAASKTLKDTEKIQQTEIDPSVINNN